MARIRARGTLLGIKYDVECTLDQGSLVITVDGREDEGLQTRFEALLEDAPPLGGTYYPPPDSLLAAYSVLQSAFFDATPALRVEGDIGEIPTYDDIDVAVY